MRLLLAVPDIDLEAKDNLEMATPLMAAIWRGALESVMELVTTPGIDLDAKDSRGRSLEEWAVGKKEILEVLGHTRCVKHIKNIMLTILYSVVFLMVRLTKCQIT